MEDLSKSWMVTFFYEQELRSYYMNGVLNGLLSPGIHNANLSIYTVDNPDNLEADKESSGVYLHIKKGSTFIFSNNYKLNKENKIEKDIDSVGTYLIKCVALEDITYDLYRWNKNFSMSDNARSFLGQDRALTHYIIASLVYDANQGSGKPGEESGAPKFLAPKFTVVKSNESFNLENQSSENSNQSLYFKCPAVKPLEIKTEEKEKGLGIPDGSKDYFESKGIMNNISWLMVGTILESNINKKTSYIATNNWNTSGANDWIKDHVFFGRGLKEYRKPLISLGGKTSPDVIPGYKLENIYMDLGTIYDENLIFEQNNNWNKINCIAAEIEPSTGYPKVPFNGTADYSFVIPSEEFTKIKNEVMSNPKFTLKNEEGSSGKSFKECVIVDTLFLNSPKHSSNMNINIEDIISSNKLSLISERNTLSTKGIRFVANPGNYNFNPAYDAENQKGSSNITHKGYSYDGGLLENKEIIPFDVCSANLNRLKSILSNRAFLPALMDTLRRENLISADEGDTLIPICIAFRKFKMYQATEGIEAESIDGFSNDKVVHPCNILSFFDIQNNSTQVNSINLKANEAYTILPVID